MTATVRIAGEDLDYYVGVLGLRLVKQAVYFYHEAIRHIDVADIHYIEGLRDYVKLQHGRVSTLALLSLKHLLHRLPADRFVRVHRSYIVALDKIEALQGDQLLVQRRTIPIGGSYRDDLMRRIEARRL